MKYVASLLLLSCLPSMGMSNMVSQAAAQIAKIYWAVPKPLVPVYAKVAIPNLFSIVDWHFGSSKKVFFEQTEPVPDHVALFIRSELRKRGVAHADAVQIRARPKFHSVGVLFEEVFIVTKNEIDLISSSVNTLGDVRWGAHKRILAMQAIIAHEAHHITEYHSHKLLAEPAVAVLLSTPLYYGLKKMMSTSLAHSLHQSWGAGLLFYAAVIIAQKMRARSFEISADEAIPNDDALLGAAQTILESTHSDRTWLEDLLASHPTPEQRAERFKQRRQALNQTQIRL